MLAARRRARREGAVAEPGATSVSCFQSFFTDAASGTFDGDEEPFSVKEANDIVESFALKLVPRCFPGVGSLAATADAVLRSWWPAVTEQPLVRLEKANRGNRRFLIAMRASKDSGGSYWRVGRLQ